MANPTSAFGWQMPTSTDLVTDLPADFEVFGQAVDSTMADLKGGTSGQILSKNSNTDMDFVWITNDQGDITGVTAGTGLTGGGTSGAVTLNVDPTYAGFTNMLYAKNAVLNSSFNIWQRGTSFSFPASTSYVNGFFADRWQTVTSANQACTVSRIATGDTTNLPNIQYATRYQRNSGQTGLGILTIAQNFETVNSIPFAGKTVTLSFYARKGANYSNPSSNLNANLMQGTGTDQNAFAGFTGSASVISQNATLTSSWQRFSFTGTVGVTATQLAIYFDFVPSGTAGAADYYDITGVQLEAGSTATPFSRNASTIQGELAACQRYFYRQDGNSSQFAFHGMGLCNSTTTGSVTIVPPVPMRTSPSVSTNIGTGAFCVQQAAGPIVSITSFTAVSYSGPLYALLDFGGASGLAAGNATRLLRSAGGAVTTIDMSAEL